MEPSRQIASAVSQPVQSPWTRSQTLQHSEGTICSRPFFVIPWTVTVRPSRYSCLSPGIVQTLKSPSSGCARYSQPLRDAARSECTSLMMSRISSESGAASSSHAAQSSLGFRLSVALFFRGLLLGAVSNVADEDWFRSVRYPAPTYRLRSKAILAMSRVLFEYGSSSI